MCSDEFAPLARAESRACGMAGQPLVVLRHPLADNRPDEVARKASAIVDEVVSVLTEPAERLADRYRHRYLKLAERQFDGAAVCTEEACLADLDRGLQPG